MLSGTEESEPTAAWGVVLCKAMEEQWWPLGVWLQCTTTTKLGGIDMKVQSVLGKHSLILVHSLPNLSYWLRVFLVLHPRHPVSPDDTKRDILLGTYYWAHILIGMEVRL